MKASVFVLPRLGWMFNSGMFEIIKTGHYVSLAALEVKFEKVAVLNRLDLCQIMCMRGSTAFYSAR